MVGIERKQMPDERSEIIDGWRAVLVRLLLKFQRALALAEAVQHIHIAMRRDVLRRRKAVQLRDDRSRIVLTSAFRVALAEQSKIVRLPMSEIRGSKEIVVRGLVVAEQVVTLASDQNAVEIRRIGFQAFFD